MMLIFCSENIQQNSINPFENIKHEENQNEINLIEKMKKENFFVEFLAIAIFCFLPNMIISLLIAYKYENLRFQKDFNKDFNEELEKTGIKNHKILCLIMICVCIFLYLLNILLILSTLDNFEELLQHQLFSFIIFLLISLSISIYTLILNKQFFNMAEKQSGNYLKMFNFIKPCLGFNLISYSVFILMIFMTTSLSKLIKFISITMFIFMNFLSFLIVKQSLVL